MKDVLQIHHLHGLDQDEPDILQDHLSYKITDLERHDLHWLSDFSTQILA
jgi:hypothetical protein